MSERVVQVRVPAPGRINRVGVGGRVSRVGWTIEADQVVYKDGGRVGIASDFTLAENGSGFIEYVHRSCRSRSRSVSARSEPRWHGGRARSPAPAAGGATGARRAWVRRWDCSGAHAAVDQPAAAALPPQLGADRVLRIAETRNAARSCEPDEMLSAMLPGGHQRHPARFDIVSVGVGDGEVQRVQSKATIARGRNPFLIATQAWVWPAGDGSAQIQWLDDPRSEIRRV